MLNYSVPQLQFLIGGFDASEYLDSISLSVPMHEPGQALLWTGRFKVSNNLKAKIAGLTHTDFSEIGTPSRWRPYQQLVRLNIRGYQSPAFRVENYRYNAQERSGEGTLTQIPTAVAGDRPGELLPTTVSGSIEAAMQRLLNAAFSAATIYPGYGLHSDGGILDVPLVTRNPWSDALRLASLNWHWLTVNGAESIVSVNGAGGGLVFTRTLEQVELVPDLAAIFQSAQKVIVTGARQVEDLTAATATPLNTTPSVPRPKFKTTTEYRPAGIVFPSLGTSQVPILFEEKTIIYQYWDDDDWTGYLPLFSTPLTAFLYDIQSQTQTGINPYGIPPPDLSIPLQTITIKRQPIGFLFPDVGVAATLTEAEILVESGLRKLTIKPVGLLFPDLGTNTSLAIEKRETLTSAAIPPGAQLTPVANNANGQPQQFEARPVLEPPQPLPTRPLKTEVLKGVANLAPLNWVPVFNKPLVVDFGFLPNQGRAEFLAQKIAIREQQRRDQVLVDLPIPDEWLVGGWPLLGKCSIGGNTYLMDGVAISIGDGEAKFGFTGGLVGVGTMAIIGGVPTLVQQPQYQISIDIEAEIVFEAVVTSVSGMASVSGMTAVAAEIVFEAVVTISSGGGGV